MRPRPRLAARVARHVDADTRALFQNSGFRRLYGARALGRVGDKLYFVAATWLAYQLTGSTAVTGLVVFLSRIPTVVGFAFGPVVDRARLDRLLLYSELAQAAVVFVVPLAAATGALSVPVLLAVVPALALLRRLSAPAEQAALPRLVADERLARANSLDSATVKSLGALAEAASGALLVLVGASALFALNGLTFLATAALFAGLAVPATDATGTSQAPREYLADLRDGLALVRRSAVGRLVVTAALAGAATGAATAVLPAFATGFGGADAYGLLVAALTVGTLGGSLLAPRLEGVPFAHVAVAGFAVAALGRVVAAYAGWPPLVYASVAVSTVPLGAYNVLVSTMLQVGVPNDHLARVSATAGSLSAVVGPFGVLAGGWLGDVVGAPTVVALSGLGLLAPLALFVGLPGLRGLPSVDGLTAGRFGVA
jgi:hypothetical protein